jgi:branched-chain amino acid transport system permease protein
MVLGYSPSFIGSVNWMLACVLAAFGGILVGPITALSPQTFALVIVPALGAALIGRFQSFGWTVGAALGIGMLQSEILKLQSTFTWLPKTGLQQSIPFLVIVAVLFLLGKRLPTRGMLTGGRFPAAPSPRRVAIPTIVLAVAALLFMSFASGLYRVSLIVSMVGALICLSLVLLTGFLGQISLAQMSFAGAAGFTLGIFATDLHVPFPIAPLLAALVAAVLGLIVGVSALRLRGVHLAVATIGLAVAISALWFQNPQFTGGFKGSTIPKPTLLGINLGISGARQGDYPRLAFGVFALVVLVLVALATINLRRGGLGRRLLAVRSNESAAAAAGVNVAATKLLVFAASAFVAGIGGAMLGYQQGQVAFQSFDVFVSLSFLAFAYLGGITTVSGALIGGALVPGGIAFTVINQWISINQYQGLIGGLGLIVTAIAYPEGIAGATQQIYVMILSRLRRVGREPSGSSNPSAPTDGDSREHRTESDRTVVELRARGAER